MSPSEVIELLAKPVYTVHQVDRLLGLPGGTARRWIDGYERSGQLYDPVVRSEASGNPIVTWGEFTEARHLSEFRYAGVPMIRLRPAVVRLRKEFPGIAYPLAHARALLQIEGREVIWRIQGEVDLEPALRIVVRNDQALLSQTDEWALSAPASRFVDAAEFSDQTGIVTRIRPFAELDDVWIDPLMQFGDPTIRGTPTAVIAEQYRAGDRAALIADAYELSQDDVQQAIRYELLRAERAAAA